MRRLWMGKFDRIVDGLLAAEAERRAAGAPVLVEEVGEMEFPGLGFTLSAKADRMDDHGGVIRIYDYKTGSAPSGKQQAAFAKQLVLEAMMVEHGAFPSLGRRPVDRVAYLQIGSRYEEKAVDLDPGTMAETRARFEELVRRYAEGQPYIARLAAEHIAHASDYDPVARRGEWDDTQRATVIEVGG
jgi:RecB family exonuclease